MEKSNGFFVTESRGHTALTLPHLSLETKILTKRRTPQSLWPSISDPASEKGVDKAFVKRDFGVPLRDAGLQIPVTRIDLSYGDR